MKYYHTITPEEQKSRPFNYSNAELCAECTGAGCKHCYDRLGLRRLGSETFPLALDVNGARPPAIVNYYATKFNRY